MDEGCPLQINKVGWLRPLHHAEQNGRWLKSKLLESLDNKFFCHLYHWQFEFVYDWNGIVWVAISAASKAILYSFCSLGFWLMNSFWKEKPSHRHCNCEIVIILLDRPHCYQGQSALKSIICHWNRGRAKKNSNTTVAKLCFFLRSTWAPLPNATHERLQDNSQGSFSSSSPLLLLPPSSSSSSSSYSSSPYMKTILKVAFPHTLLPPSCLVNGKHSSKNCNSFYWTAYWGKSGMILLD